MQQVLKNISVLYNGLVNYIKVFLLFSREKQIKKLSQHNYHEKSDEK